MADKYRLRRHAKGYYTKNVNGKQYYFSKNKTEALKQLKQLYSALDGSSIGSPLKLAEVANRWLTHQETRVQAHEITEATFRNSHQTAAALIRHFGKQRYLSTITPAQFTELHREWLERFKLATVSKHITNLSALLRFANENDYISEMPKLGSLRRPKRHKVMKDRNPNKRAMTLTECQRLLDVATDDLRAMTLLSLNAALGAADLAHLEPSHVHGEWLRYPRPKTGEDRVAWLWEPTRRAIHDALPFDGNANSIQGRLCRFMHDAGVTATVYSMRATAATVMAECRDEQALRLIMGHADGSMLSHYVDHTGEDRVQQLCEHMYQWIYQSADTTLKVVG